MCNIRGFTDCESCKRPISTNPGSMEAGKYELKRGTCFVSRRLEVVRVAGLLWVSWCVLGAAGFRLLLSFFFFERTRPDSSMTPPCFIYLSTSSIYLVPGTRYIARNKLGDFRTNERTSRREDRLCIVCNLDST